MTPSAATANGDVDVESLDDDQLRELLKVYFYSIDINLYSDRKLKGVGV